MPRVRRMDAATELAERLVQQLTSRRAEDSYPLTLQQLADLAGGEATQDLFAKAIKKKFFKDRVALGKLDKAVSLVALAEDRALLAGDPRLLESALRAATPTKAAAQPVAKVASKVPADMREAFAEALERRIREKKLPAGIGLLEVDGSPRLYLRDRLPESIIVADLTGKLLEALEAERARGPEYYPTTLPRLIALVASQASPAVLKKALAADAFLQRVVLAAPRNAQSPIAFKEDLEQLAGSRLLLEFVLQCAMKPAVKAFPAKDMKKALAENLRQPFVDAVNWNLEHGKLPATVGWVWIKTPHLFFVRDMHAGVAGTSPGPRPAEHKPDAPAKDPSLARQACIPRADGAPDFADAFAAAFERLDRQTGGRNFVSLVEVRRALPVARGAFDAELFKLRQAGSFSLSAAEGRHGISAEEREAGIYEEGALLLFVSRNRS